MKWVIINDTNKQRIIEAINYPQYRCSERLLTTDLINYCIDSVMHRIGNMPKSKLEGTIIHITQQQHFPSSYKYIPESTQCKLLYSKGNWRIDFDSVCRTTCPNNNKCRPYDLHLSAGAKLEILKQFE